MKKSNGRLSARKSMRADFFKTDQWRTTLSDAPTVDIDVTELLIEKEPLQLSAQEKGG